MRTFIWLALVALACASPIDDKSIPDISQLPLKHDVTLNSTAKPIDSYDHDGVHAHPLHKREAPKAVPTVDATHPLPPSSSNLNNQQKVETPLHPLQSNLQPNLASSSRVRRDDSHKKDQPLAPQPALIPSVNSQQKTQDSSKVQTPAQGARVTRDVSKQADKKSDSKETFPIQVGYAVVDKPKPDSKATDSKAKAPDSQESKEKAPKPIDDSKSPIQIGKAVPTPSLTRASRDIVKPTDAKSSSQPTANLGQSPQLPTVAPKPTDVKTSAQGSRTIRETPKATDDKATAPQPAVVSKPPAQVYKPSDPVAPSSAASNVRKVRDAPNPIEQSKIVPTAATSNDSTDLKPTHDSPSLNPVLAAKPTSSVSLPSPQHKRDTPPSSVLPPSPSNSSPSFVHPVPVDQILKKPGNSTSVADSKAQSDIAKLETPPEH